MATGGDIMDQAEGRRLSARRPLGGLARGVGEALRALRRVLSSSRALAVFVLIIVVQVRALDPSPAVVARYEGLDLLNRLHPQSFAERHVLIVDVDEASIAELGQWPWPRTTIARMVERLNAANPAAIGFDIVFSEPDRLSPENVARTVDGLPPLAQGLLLQMPPSDARLAEAIAAAPVVLGASGREFTLEGAETAAAAPDPTAPFVPLGGPGDRQPDPERHVFAFPSMLSNLPELVAAADGQGLFTLTPEHDGVVRRVPALLRIGDDTHPSLSMEMLRVASGAVRYGAVENATGDGMEGVRLRRAFLPTDANGRFWLHAAPHEPSLYVSAADIVDGRVDPARIAGKFVLVGTSAVGLRDIRRTSLEQSIPGVEVHAQIIDTVMAGDFLARPGWTLAAEHAAAILGSLLLIAVAPALTSARALPVFIGLAAIAAGAAYGVYVHAGIALDATYPIFAFAVVFAALVYANFSRTEAQRRQIRSAFSQYLSPDLVKQLSEAPEKLSLGGESREMTFLFCDLAGFTSFVERADPETLVRLLNQYLDGVCGVVMSHGGTIDKIVGDAVHAMFNAPLDEPEHADKAVRCALAIEAFVAQYRAEMSAQGHEFGTTRIGVNTGRAIVGNFGGGSRFDYTAHGDAINTAARLEGANKYLGTTICVAETTAALCPSLRFRPIGGLLLKGKEIPVETCEPIREGADEERLAAYEAAFAHMAAGRTAPAEAGFAALAELDASDPLAALHLKRLRGGAQGSAIELEGK